ncbi:MAG: ribosomal-processing cysteine protease Prp [Lachnospiraceae bacterium]|nr:ribosomal-processing cysteine protease Prp [Lachnospiraceae bacterium]MBQ8117555.1 ribosomal-processing cysteine protease Prp [Lachnospiraceae bacterium]
MTTVEIRKDKKGSYRQIICMGHAGYAKAGEDIVCAAISVLVISAMNSLEGLAGEKFSETADEETGFMNFVFPEDKPLQEKSVFLLDAMVYSLENLSREYGKKYLQVKVKEV